MAGMASRSREHRRAGRPRHMPCMFLDITTYEGTLYTNRVYHIHRDMPEMQDAIPT